MILLWLKYDFGYGLSFYNLTLSPLMWHEIFLLMWYSSSTGPLPLFPCHPPSSLTYHVNVTFLPLPFYLSYLLKFMPPLTPSIFLCHLTILALDERGAPTLSLPPQIGALSLVDIAS